MSATRKFDGIGRCIYCPTAEGKLGEEHIIARAFGGLLIMKDASCSECERITSGIETRCATNLFGPAQSYFNLKARKSREVPKRVRIDLGGPGAPRRTSVPAAEHPNVLWLFGFVGPGLLVGRDPAEKIGVQIMPTPLEPGWLDRITALGGSYFSRGVDSAIFGRLLAKTAHAYAMATKAGQFEPCLIDHIRGTSKLPLSHFIGRRVEPQGVGNSLHEIGMHRETLADGRSFWFVRLRLFATTPNTPIHDIVVGQAID